MTSETRMPALSIDSISASPASSRAVTPEGAGQAPVSGDQPRHYRIGKQLSRAIDEIVNGARTITEAAERADMRRESLSIALQKPHVIAELDVRVRRAQSVRGARALSVIEKLMDGAGSEYVKLDAAKSMADRSGYGVRDQAGGKAVAGLGLQININLGAWKGEDPPGGR